MHCWTVKRIATSIRTYENMPVSQQHLTEIQILSMRVLSFHKIFSMSVQLIEYQDGSLMVEGVSV